MYQLKCLPEDFVVKEIPKIALRPKGRYLYLKLLKKNWNTMEAVQSMAKALGIKDKQIGFAGSKDRRAITEQVCSLCGVRKEQVLNMHLPGISLTFLGYGDTPISLGDLQGNSFEIVIRNLEKTEKVQPLSFIPNYFDEQRFGKENLSIGKYLLKKQFAEAAACLKSAEVEAYLQQHPNDYIGALKLLPLRLLRLYLNAYQSYLWNETLAQYLRKANIALKEIPYSLGSFALPYEENFHEENSLQELKIPLIGFDYKETPNNEKVQNILRELMKSEGISAEDFILKQIPQLTLEGEMRKAFGEVKGLSLWEAEDDELHPGKKKVKVSFTLPKGSYATMVVRGMMAESGGKKDE